MVGEGNLQEIGPPWSGRPSIGLIQCSGTIFSFDLDVWQFVIALYVRCGKILCVSFSWVVEIHENFLPTNISMGTVIGK